MAPDWEGHQRPRELDNQMKMPNAHLCVIDREKIADYLLNPVHRHGASKARFFGEFGFQREAWEVLAGLEGAGAARSTGGRRPRKTPARQMALFNPAQPLVDEIGALDIPNMTPLEAINVLYGLQKKAHGQGEGG